jgi:hypothetical protein
MATASPVTLETPKNGGAQNIWLHGPASDLLLGSGALYILFFIGTKRIDHLFCGFAIQALQTEDDNHRLSRTTFICRPHLVVDINNREV